MRDSESSRSASRRADEQGKLSYQRDNATRATHLRPEAIMPTFQHRFFGGDGVWIPVSGENNHTAQK